MPWFKWEYFPKGKHLFTKRAFSWDFQLFQLAVSKIFSITTVASISLTSTALRILDCCVINNAKIIFYNEYSTFTQCQLFSGKMRAKMKSRHFQKMKAVPSVKISFLAYWYKKRKKQHLFFSLFFFFFIFILEAY